MDAFRISDPKFARQDEVYPSAKLYHAQIPKDPSQRWETVVPITEELKVKARKLGLWNLFLSKAHYPQHGVPLSNLEVRFPFRYSSVNP